MTTTVSLVLSFQWFDMIASGIKREEYREIKPRWDKQIWEKQPTVAVFYRGYEKADVRKEMKVEISKISKGFPNSEWSDTKLFIPGQEVYVLSLGRILSANFDLYLQWIERLV